MNEHRPSKERLFKSLLGISKSEHLRHLASEMHLSAGILNECAALFDDIDGLLGALAECFDETEEEFSDIRDMRGRIRGELVAPSRPTHEPATTLPEGFNAITDEKLAEHLEVTCSTTLRSALIELQIRRASQPPRADLPKPINHDLWRHLHDEHGLTLLQSELDEILRIAQPPASPLTDEAIVAFVNQWDQGPRGTYEFDPQTLVRMMRSFAATVEGMVVDGASKPSGNARALLERAAAGEGTSL